jgi:hypothetical protein
MVLPARVTEDVNEAVVISSRDELAVVRKVNVVDVRAVCAQREDAVHKPAELGVVGRPRGAFGV